MRVLLATDGSASADRARDLVASLAWPGGTIVRIVTAVEPQLQTVSAPFAMSAANVVDELDAQLVRYAEETLDVAERTLRETNLAVERMAVHERAADAISDIAREWDASLVVLGNRGHSPLSTLILGSTSAEVVDHAPCPVLVARDRVIDEVVFGTDGSPSAIHAERILTDWQMFRDLPTSVVSVGAIGGPPVPGLATGLYDAVTTSYTEDLDAARRRVADVAEAAAARLRRESVEASTHVREGDAAAELVAFARGRSHPLIVLGSRGHTGLARLLLGGVARNVLHHATGSVLIVRAGVPVATEPVDAARQLIEVG